MLNNTKRKVLILHWGFIPGGVSTYARLIDNVDLYAPLELKGLCINSPEWLLDETILHFKNMEFIYIKNKADLSWVWKTRSMILREKPDLIFTFGFNGAFVAALAGLCTGIPIYTSWHGEYYPSTLQQKFRKPIFEIILRTLFRSVVKKIVTVSEYSKDILIGKGIDAEKITVVHNGVATDAAKGMSRSALKEELQVPINSLIVGTACRLVAPKGLPFFLRSIALAVEANQNLRFVIWGDGPERDHLATLIRHLKIDEFVKLPGHQPDASRYLGALDIFVLSSSAENFPIVLIEAMRAGLPIIATKVGGVSEAVENGANAVLISFGDEKALADAIVRVAADSDLRHALGQEARKRFFEAFTSDVMILKTAGWLMAPIA